MEPLRGWLGEWADAIGYHHEHWDGTGYPRGTAGEAIPLGGRDRRDRRRLRRDYLHALLQAVGDPAEARAELVRARTQFDPRLVRAFVNISLGRMRFLVGPLSWLSNAPFLVRLPLTPSLGATIGGVAALASAATAGPAVARQPRGRPAVRSRLRSHASRNLTASTVAFVPHDPAFRVIRQCASGTRRCIGTLARPVGRVAGAQAPTAAPTPTKPDSDAGTADERRRRLRRLSDACAAAHTPGAADDHGDASDDDRTPGAAHDDHPAAGAADDDHPADDHATPGAAAVDQRGAELHGRCQPGRARGLRRTCGGRLGDRDFARACVRELADGDVHLSSRNTGLFSVAPAVAPNGTLTFTSAPDANGVAHVKVAAVETAEPITAATTRARRLASRSPSCR